MTISAILSIPSILVYSNCRFREFVALCPSFCIFLGSFCIMCVFGRLWSILGILGYFKIITLDNNYRCKCSMGYVFHFDAWRMNLGRNQRGVLEPKPFGYNVQQELDCCFYHRTEIGLFPTTMFWWQITWNYEILVLEFLVSALSKVVC